MCVIINYYSKENKHLYQCANFGRDGLYIKSINNKYHIFYKKYYYGTLNNEQKTYNLIDNLLYIGDKFNIHNDKRYIKLLKRLLKWTNH